ncbi:tyrosine-type recombinase/integrase [Brevibacillus sp. B_LB10_24]|uniref:tyrosine-type recombinase/integrase n=1 Tax=Brevibacillus sp. B_LB10_24 TaxID=3380645 RepID=UPI0038B7ACC5
MKLKETKQPEKILQHTEISALYQACVNIRDQLILRLLYEGGLRIGEAVNLWLEDISINDCSIRVRKSKTRAGEGRKVYVSKETINLLQDYILEYHMKDIDTNFLFYNLAGINKGKPFSTQGMYSLVKRLRKKTGIYFTPHMFRHTFANELHENGVDIIMIQKLLGHAHVQTTMQIYMHPSDKALRESYEQAQKKKIVGERNITWIKRILRIILKPCSLERLMKNWLVIGIG